ncbi:hypothetical protein ACOSQ2_033120 [Xanthoceras sorbifolium]
MALIALLDYKIHHHIHQVDPWSKVRVLRGSCPPSGFLVQGACPPRVMSTKCSWSRAHPPRITSTKWTFSPRCASSEVHIHQVDL